MTVSEQNTIKNSLDKFVIFLCILIVSCLVSVFTLPSFLGDVGCWITLFLFVLLLVGVPIFVFYRIIVEC